MSRNQKTEGAGAAAKSADASQGGGSIVYALTILRYLSESGDSIGVTALAKRLNISPSSCFNILKTLVSQDVVEFSQRDKTYTIGYGLLHIVHELLSHNRLVPQLAPGMRKLADKYSAAVGLWRVSSNERPVLISIAEAEASIRIHLTMGQRLPQLAGSVGRLVAAHRNFAAGEFARIFSKLRLSQPVSAEEYLKDIELTRRRGFSIDAGVWFQGVTSIAAPIVNAAGELIYGLSATIFSGQLPKKELPVIGEELRTLASRSST